MFDQSFSFILTIAALVVGFMLFTGHGSFFMKGGNTQARAQKYDEKKMDFTNPFPDYFRFIDRIYNVCFCSACYYC